MKIKIQYSIITEKEIEISPADYCQLRANTDKYPEIFPAESCARSIWVMDEESHNELYDFFAENSKKKPLTN